jgi:hypothetical protein
MNKGSLAAFLAAIAIAAACNEAVRDFSQTSGSGGGSASTSCALDESKVDECELE